MATTTNFGWETPDDTDLVKDGALAMRTLGNAIDASMVDLKGGTTGQVLSKASNTDMDFTWVAQDDSNAIQNAIVDAKGDLIAASAADTPARLAVGNNGETLVADSSATTGLRYTAGNAVGNPVLNSSFQIWQRGTSVAFSSTAYGPDRWQAFRAAGGATVSRQVTNDTTNLPNIQYCARIQRDNGNSNVSGVTLSQTLESANSIPYAGKTITFSFYARASASMTGFVYFSVIGGTGTDQNVNSGFTGSTTIINANPTLTTTWTRYSYTATVGTTITQLGIQAGLAPSGTAGASDFLEVTGFQIDLGSVALPFRTYSATLAGELAACQRYYWRARGAVDNYAFSLGWADSATVFVGTIPFPVTMRVRPTALETTGTASNYKAVGPAVSATATAVTYDGTTTDFQGTVVLTTGSVLTTGRGGQIRINGSQETYLAWSAEL